MLRRNVADLAPSDLDGRRVLIRVDYNVPLAGDGSVSDITRVRATLPTLRHVMDCGGRPVLLSHLGRPKGQVVPSMSLAPVAPVLAEELLNTDGKAVTAANVEAFTRDVVKPENVSTRRISPLALVFNTKLVQNFRNGFFAAG